MEPQQERSAEAARPPQAAVPKQQRLLSLDVFRGLTLLGMVLVNNHGSTQYIYPPLRHVSWHGWGFTDLVFPFFVFIVGVAIPFSLENLLARGASRKALWLRIFRRAVLLFALGLLLNGFPTFDLSTLRIFGVLQRIAICYLVASVIYLHCRPKAQVAIAASLLVLYFVVMKYVPVPGYGPGVLEREGNWAQYIDLRVLAGHMQSRTFEGKGLLSTLPAIATALVGLLTGQYLRSPAASLEKAVNLYFFGTLGLLAGSVWDWSFPINQKLWTSSLVLFMGGMALVVLASCYYLVDIKQITWWTPPLLVFGLNSIAVWVLTSLFRQTLELIMVTGSDGSAVNVKTYVFNLLAAWVGPWNGSLLFAIAYVLLWLGIMSLLYRRRIFIKL